MGLNPGSFGGNSWLDKPSFSQVYECNRNWTWNSPHAEKACLRKEPTQRTTELRHMDSKTKTSNEHLNPGHQDFVAKMTQIHALSCLSWVSVTCTHAVESLLIYYFTHTWTEVTERGLLIKPYLPETLKTSLFPLILEKEKEEGGEE